MLKYRIPAALTIAALFLVACWYDWSHGTSWAFSAFVAAGSVIVLREFYQMVEAKGARPTWGFGLLMVVLLVLGHDRWCWEKWHGLERLTPDRMMTVLAVVVLGTFLIQVLRRGPRGTILNVGSTLLGLVYVWFLPAFLVKIRHLGLRPEPGSWVTDGVELLVLTVGLSKIADMGAYFTGRNFGRRKLSPVLSPAKTWEGAAGGVAASIAGMFVLRAVFPESVFGSFDVWTALSFAILMAVGGLFGDLMASALKRDSGLKHSGDIVPGFGGFLDVVDSIMVAAPVAYFFLLLIGARHPEVGG